MYEKAQKLPTEKWDYPITEAQEIGWDTTPLVSAAPCVNYYNTLIIYFD